MQFHFLLFFFYFFFQRNEERKKKLKNNKIFQYTFSVAFFIYKIEIISITPPLKFIHSLIYFFFFIPFIIFSLLLFCLVRLFSLLLPFFFIGNIENERERERNLFVFLNKLMLILNEREREREV